MAAERVSVAKDYMSDAATVREMKKHHLSILQAFGLCIITSAASVLGAYLTRPAAEIASLNCAKKEDVAALDAKVTALSITMNANADKAHNETSALTSELHSLVASLSVLRAK